jgi:hypothetical protein
MLQKGDVLNALEAKGYKGVKLYRMGDGDKAIWVFQYPKIHVMHARVLTPYISDLTLEVWLNEFDMMLEETSMMKLGAL